jgi:hypothetical protein
LSLGGCLKVLVGISKFRIYDVFIPRLLTEPPPMSCGILVGKRYCIRLLKTRVYYCQLRSLNRLSCLNEEGMLRPYAVTLA